MQMMVGPTAAGPYRLMNSRNKIEGGKSCIVHTQAMGIKGFVSASSHIDGWQPLMHVLSRRGRYTLLQLESSSAHFQSFSSQKPLHIFCPKMTAFLLLHPRWGFTPH